MFNVELHVERIPGLRMLSTVGKVLMLGMLQWAKYVNVM